MVVFGRCPAKAGFNGLLPLSGVESLHGKSLLNVAAEDAPSIVRLLPSVAGAFPDQGRQSARRGQSAT
jgi:hypothetical protein